MNVQKKEKRKRSVVAKMRLSAAFNLSSFQLTEQNRIAMEIFNLGLQSFVECRRNSKFSCRSFLVQEPKLVY